MLQLKCKVQLRKIVSLCMKSILLVMYRHRSISFLRQKDSEGRASSKAVITKTQNVDYFFWLVGWLF